MNALTKLEPIPLPDLRRPTAMPSLPGWLATQRSALLENLQPVQGKFQDVLTLPSQLLPSEAQKIEIDNHCRFLRSSLEQTPAASSDWEMLTLTAVTKMLLVLSSQKASELAAEAKAEAYGVALEDVPYWAVECAAKRWYRAACGNDENGQPYDYKWMPAPGVLRRIALLETNRVRTRVLELEQVIHALPFVDTTAELERGRAAWTGLRSMANSDGLKDLTFERAVKLGRGEKVA